VRDSATPTFRAFAAASTNGSFQRGLVEMPITDLPPDGVLIAVRCSSINFKDALAASANGQVARISPLVVGIDLAGEIIEGAAGDLGPGDLVIAHGYDIGVARHGGCAELARVPADWIVPLPSGLSLDEAMTIGTAGYTAALAALSLLDHGRSPASGPVLVTGATGGVGSFAVNILAGLGFQVVASTGKPDAEDYLRKLGAADVISRAAITDDPRPLKSARWSGAIDCVGGSTLSAVLAQLSPGGAVAATGNTGGAALETTVLPFILRGVALLGIDSVSTAIERRRDVWQRLGTDLKPRDLDDIRTVVGLADVDAAMDAIARGGATGRYVIRISQL
jgi:acrylyl-CoA reductase (NADPH)